MRCTEGKLGNAADIEHHLRTGRICRDRITQLPLAIRTPTQDGAVEGNRAGVVPAHADMPYLRQHRRTDWGVWRGPRSQIT